MSNSDPEVGIRKDYKRGMSYREIAKKHRKSFTQIAKILNNPKTLSERVELLEKRIKGLEDDKPYGDMAYVSIIHSDIQLRCPNCDEPVEWNDIKDHYECSSCDWAVD